MPAARPVNPHVSLGAHDFVSFAWAQCHALDGRGGVSPAVPALTGAKTLTSAELKQIINHGTGLSADPKKPYMPVWGQVISDRQVDDLVAYIHAGLPKVSAATPVQPVMRSQPAHISLTDTSTTADALSPPNKKGPHTRAPLTLPLDRTHSISVPFGSRVLRLA